MKGRLPAYKQSFFLSPEREDGLQLEIFYGDGLVYADFFVNNRFEGYANVVHGGMIFGVLDVILWYIIFMETKKIGMTRKIEMEFFKPVVCSTHYNAKGRFLAIDGRDIHATAWVEDQNGEVYAKVNGIFREAREGIDIHSFIDRFEFDTAAPEIKEYFLSLLKESQ